MEQTHRPAPGRHRRRTPLWQRIRSVAPRRRRRSPLTMEQLSILGPRHRRRVEITHLEDMFRRTA